ncbi:unnamed protein product [Phaedon cochleariae]|uniref:Myb/SANT-like DNA-binding domain-containing protein n=1 Tax=Phaedon cochleariae TaxID=80249 RepID=A0A9N9X523_PHACE|nr:unnamed protein product [Phaedon cochleariae]
MYFSDLDFAVRYLQAIGREFPNDSETSVSVIRNDSLILSDEEIQSKEEDANQEYESKFKAGQFKQGWKLISTTLNEGGINASPQQCSSEMDTLKRRSKAIKDSQSETGATPITWEYYSVMSNLFDKKSWAQLLQGAVSSTGAFTYLNINEMARGCSEKAPKKRQVNIDVILTDLKMERQKRDEERKMRLEERNRRREEYEMEQDQRHKEKFNSRELIH